PVDKGEHVLDDVAGARIDNVRRPEPAGGIQLGRVRVDRDDLRSAPDTSSLHDAEPDPAATEHRNGCPRPHWAGAEGGAHTCYNTAREEARLFKRESIRDLDGLAGVDDRARRERA